MSVYRFPLPTLFSASFPNAGARADVDRVMSEMFTGRANSSLPLADAREDATGFTIELDIPGVAPESVEVLAEEGVLTIHATRAARELSDGEKAVFAERTSGKLSRRFRLPKSADLSAISASYALGVLSVRVGKLAPAQPRKVTVNVQS